MAGFGNWDHVPRAPEVHRLAGLVSWMTGVHWDGASPYYAAWYLGIDGTTVPHTDQEGRAIGLLTACRLHVYYSRLCPGAHTPWLLLLLSLHLPSPSHTLVAISIAYIRFFLRERKESRGQEGKSSSPLLFSSPTLWKCSRRHIPLFSRSESGNGLTRPTSQSLSLLVIHSFL